MSGPIEKLLLTVDLVLFTIRDRALHALLIRRLVEPFRGEWALPGGFVLPDESVEEAAARELREEAGVEHVYLEQLYTFGDPGRDPRGRVVTVAYYALVPQGQPLRAGSDAGEAAWFPVAALPPTAFDHARILAYALERLRNKLDYSSVGFELLPPRFTLSELQRVHEAILGEAIDKRNFRRRMLQEGIVEALEEWQPTGRRPAQLFRFASRR